MSIALQLSHDEPRLVYLALVYHLGRPGSELDPETLEPIEDGLRQVKTALGNDLTAQSAIVELGERGFHRLLSAIYGSVNELRVYHMRDGAGSTVPRFAETARSLFPELADDPAAALDIAEAMMMLHRRIERALRHMAQESTTAQARQKRRWFGRG